MSVAIEALERSHWHVGAHPVETSPTPLPNVFKHVGRMRFHVFEKACQTHPKGFRNGATHAPECPDKLVSPWQGGTSRLWRRWFQHVLDVGSDTIVGQLTMRCLANTIKTIANCSGPRLTMKRPWKPVKSSDIMSRAKTVWCRSWSRYVEGCWGFPYLKLDKCVGSAIHGFW